MDLPKADLVNILYPLGIQHKQTAGLKRLAYQIYFQFKNQVPATLEELLMIRGVGHKIALLTLQYAFNKIQVRDLVGISIFIFITHEAFLGHSGWYSCPKFGEISRNDWVFQCKVLSTIGKKNPQDYWEQFNITFGCISQIIANNIIPESVVMGTLIGELAELKHSIKKDYQHYHEELIKNEYVNALDDE